MSPSDGDVYVDGGESVCGRCFAPFTDDRPPHEASRRRVEASGTYDYREPDPWHAECIAEANAGGQQP